MAMPVYVVVSATEPAASNEDGLRVWWVEPGVGIKRYIGSAWETIAVASGSGGPHTHPESDIIGLVADLAARQLTSEKGQANGYASLDGTGKVPAAQLPAASDPWTYAQVNSGADFTTTSATAVDATGLSFTPAANTTYEFEALLMIRTATATVNPRVGLAWATGLTDGVATIQESQSATAQVLANGNINAALLAAVGGLPNTTQSWPVLVKGFVRAGATPSGTVRLRLASETAGTTVRIVARSWLKYRTLPF